MLSLEHLNNVSNESLEVFYHNVQVYQEGPNNMTYDAIRGGTMLLYGWVKQ
jgi:hypothetical protein